MEKENAKLVNAKGELSEDSASSYEKLRKSYDHLYRNISSLAEALDMQPPVMPEDGTTRLTAGDEASPSGTVKDTSVPEPIWDDEDTKTFYECLPDLRAFVPAVLLGEAEPKSNEQSAKAKEKLSVSGLHSTLYSSLCFLKILLEDINCCCYV
jgi:regulator of nonsense transcripts 2